MKKNWYVYLHLADPNPKHQIIIKMHFKKSMQIEIVAYVVYKHTQELVTFKIDEHGNMEITFYNRIFSN